MVHGQRTTTILAWLSAAILVGPFTVAFAQTPVAESPVATGRFVDRVFSDATGPHKYVVFEPRGYTPDKKWPVIFYLHGASGRGRDGRASLIVGLGPGLKERAAKSPFLVVFAQNEDLRSRLLGGWTDDRQELDRALQILATVEREYSVDTSRRVLAGVSMGAFGVWQLAAQTPTHWHCVVPVSGGGSIAHAKQLAQVPIWAFHAEDDTLVPPTESTDLVAAIRKHGGRAFVSILPKGGHNIGGPVFAQDEIWEWMENPQTDPRSEIDWSTRRSTAPLIDELPFVVGAEVERAIRVRINKDVLESLAETLPAQVPTDSLNGWRPGQAEQRQQGPLTITVATTGLQYSGMVERVAVTPLADNLLRVQMGFRNLIFTVPSTQISSALINARASAMQIQAGVREPLWLTVDVRPAVVNRQIKLQLTNVEFQIPQDNWALAGPAQVDVSLLPMLESRITNQLVQGLAQRKPQIEGEIRNSAPKLVEQLEQRLSTLTAQTVTPRAFPMPLWQPRFKLFAEHVAVDAEGISLSLGAQVAAIAPRTATMTPKLIPVGDEAETPLARTGVRIAVSERMIRGWSELLSNSDVARFHVQDMSAPEIRRLGDQAFWSRLVPSGSPWPKDAALNAEFVLRKPLAIGPVRETEVTQPMVSGFTMHLPQLQLVVSQRDPATKAWRDLATADLAVQQHFALGIDRPSFMRRQLTMKPRPAFIGTASAAVLTATKPVPIDPQPISTQFLQGWNETFQPAGRDNALADLQLSGIPLRWEQLVFAENHFQLSLSRPAIRVRNVTGEPAEYQVKGSTSPWSEPLRLEPGAFHDFQVPTALLYRTGPIDRPTQYSVPLGMEVRIESSGRLTTPTLASEPAQANRR